MINFFELKLIDHLNFSQDSLQFKNSDLMIQIINLLRQRSMRNIFEGIYFCDLDVVVHSEGTLIV